MTVPEGIQPPGPSLVAPSIVTAREVPVLVSVITPTRNRDTFLAKTLAHFRNQDYRNIEWHILDDSPRPTACLSEIDDKNIFKAYPAVSGSSIGCGQRASSG
jgi:hypothetical protein